MKLLHTKFLLNLLYITTETLLHAGPCQSRTLHVRDQITETQSIITQKPKIRLQDLPLEARRHIFEYVPKHNSRFTQLQQAVISHNIDTIRTLLVCTADPNETKQSYFVTDLPNQTPLYTLVKTSSCKKNPEQVILEHSIAQLLILHGADVNKANGIQETPLHAAVQTGNLPMIQCLIRSGANVTKQNFRNKTPLDIAIQNAMNHHLTTKTRKKYYKICGLLIESGATSSINLESIPTDVIMEQQHQEYLSSEKQRNIPKQKFKVIEK